MSCVMDGSLGSPPRGGVSAHISKCPRALAPAPFPEVLQRFPTGSNPEDEFEERPEPRDTGLDWFAVAGSRTSTSDNRKLEALKSMLWETRLKAIVRYSSD